MYDKIKNPLTNRFVNVNSHTGKSIIQNYINVLNGGAHSMQTRAKSVKAKKNWKKIKKNITRSNINRVLNRIQQARARIDNNSYVGVGGGKGKGGFQGNCHHCGEFGHSVRNCALKDKQMQEYRAANGIPEPSAFAGKGGLHAVGAEGGTNQSPSNPAQNMTKDIAALESKGSYRYLSQLGTMKPRAIKVKNRYGILEEEPEEIQDTNS